MMREVLIQIKAHEGLKAKFEERLEKSFTLESWQFWQAIQELIEAPGQGEETLHKMQSLLEEYLLESSPHEVPIEGRLKIEWRTLVEKKTTEEAVILKLANRARSEIERIMIVDIESFHRECKEEFERLSLFSKLPTKSLLMVIRKNSELKLKFEEHMEKRYSVENWHFWESVSSVLEEEYNDKFIFYQLKDVQEKHLLESSNEEVAIHGTLKLEWRNFLENKELLKEAKKVVKMLKKAKSEVERMMIQEVDAFYKQNEQEIDKQQESSLSQTSLREFLFETLRNVNIRSKFEASLKKKFSLENWVFWQSVSCMLEGNWKPEQLYNQLQKILHNHLLDSSFEEVGIAGSIKREWKTLVENKELLNDTCRVMTMLKCARSEIERIMMFDVESFRKQLHLEMEARRKKFFKAEPLPRKKEKTSMINVEEELLSLGLRGDILRVVVGGEKMNKSGRFYLNDVKSSRRFDLQLENSLFDSSESS